MGIVFGLSAGLFFAIAAILSRVGMRTRGRDDGLFMSILMNVLVLAALTASEVLPAWDTAAIVALAVGGVLGTFGGRATNLRAVRLIGPTRATAFLTGGPLVAAVGGWIFLDEALSPLEGLGGLLVVAGLLLLVRLRSTAQPVAGSSAPVSERDRAFGYLVAAMAPILFGLAFVVRKWGLNLYPAPMAGAFVGAAAGMVVLVAGDAAGGRMRRRLAENFRDVPWWFVAAGVSTSAALVSQFLAFDHLDAWVVSLLQSTQIVWALVLASVFLRREEGIDRRVVGAVALVALGVAAATIQL